MEPQNQAFSKCCSLCGNDKLLTHFLSNMTTAGRIHGSVCDYCLGFTDLASKGKRKRKPKLIFNTEALLKKQKIQDDDDGETDWGSGDRGKLLKNLLQFGAQARSASRKLNTEQQEKNTEETKSLEGSRFRERLTKTRANIERGKQAEKSIPSKQTNKPSIDKTRQHNIEGFVTGGYNLLNTNFSKTFITQPADSSRISSSANTPRPNFQFTKKMAENNKKTEKALAWNQTNATISKTRSSLLASAQVKPSTKQEGKASQTIDNILKQARNIWKK